MKKYIKDFFSNIIKGTMKKKICAIIVLLLYIFIAIICIVPLQVSSTSPGSITSVSSVIDVESDTKTSKRIYTVSVYSKTKASILEYLLAKLDSNTDIEIDKREDDIYTVSEEEKIDVIAKEQSIQDAIITAYDTALNKGYDVNLDYVYKGIRVACIPVNSLKTGPESLQIGDIITSINGVNIDNIDTFEEIVIEIYNKYKDKTLDDTLAITIIRKNEEISLDNCNSKSLAILGNYASYFDSNTPEYYFYEYYSIDENTAKPKFTINKAYSSGPSGGLIQTLYVYDCITNGSIINDKYILGTGTISRNGSIGEIGAVEQKVLTANYYQAQYFFVPSANYEDALKKYESIKNPTFKLIKVDNFIDAINALEGE